MKKSLSFHGLEIDYVARKKMTHLRVFFDEWGHYRVSGPILPNYQVMRLLDTYYPNGLPKLPILCWGKPCDTAFDLVSEMRKEWLVCLERFYPRIGIKPTMRLVKMYGRWGSCQPIKKEIHLSKTLIRFPKSCFHMVVAHELCHLLVPNHQKEFYDLLSELVPNWKQLNQILKKGCEI